ERRLEQQVAAAVRRLTVPGSTGDVLVFLPGAAEIRQAASACAELARHRDLLLTPLHGDLSAAEQDRALAAGSRRKVILSTNVAETSVTVPGVTSVVDSGLARIASHSPWSGLPTLNVARISRASAAQRAGRAGRLGPGRVLRLYTRHDLDARGDATELGRACAKLPLHPRLARLAVEAARRGYRDDGCTAAALLNERDARGDPGLAPTGPSDVLDLLERRRSPRAEQARAQLLRLAPPEGPRSAPREEAILLSVLAGFPDRVAKRRGADLLLASGGAAQLSPESAVRDADLLVAVDAEQRQRGNRTRVLIRVASAIEAGW